VAGRVLASYVNGQSDTYFKHANALGSWGLTTAHDGSVPQDQLYYPWGQTWTSGHYLFEPNWAAMSWYNAESNLFLTPARSYSSRLGRWMSPDPLGGDVTNPQSLNRYAYVLNNPTSLIDPLGLQGSPPGCPQGMNTEWCYGGIPGFFAGGTQAFTFSSPTWNSLNTVFSPTYMTGQNGDYTLAGGGLDPNGLALLLLLQNGPATGLIAGLNFGIKKPGQTFKGCMQQNANTYSIGGAAELSANTLTGTNTSISSNALVGAVTGNNINTFLFGSGTSAAASMAANAPGIVSTAMGSSLTWGRRTASIMSLNLSGIGGGPPLALSSASGGLKSLLGSIGNALNLGMDFSTKLGVDAAFTGAEAIGCSMTMSF